MSDITVNNFKAFYEQIRPYLGAVHSGFTPIGTIISVMGTTAPMNYLACDGTAYNISDYPELAAYFNQQFGSSNFFGGDGTTTFAVPDLRGEFLRGTGTNSHANQGNGANVGVHQDASRFTSFALKNDGAETQLHFNSDEANTYSWIGTSNSDKNVIANKQISVNVSNVSTSSQYDTRVSARPTNTSVLYCIASKNIFMDAGSNYSTEEQVVGTWIDGRPIYQKTFGLSTGVNISVNTWINVDAPLSGAERIILCNGYNNNGVIPLYANPRSGANGFVIYSAIALNDVTNFTLQYTKTTDA